MGIKNIIGELQVNGKRVLTTEDGVGGGSGGGKAIIDVDTLPTDNINEDAFYRTQTAQFVGEALESIGFVPNVIVVPEKPETGVTVLNMETGEITGYLDLSDGKLYGYVDDALRAVMLDSGLSEFVLDTYIINGWIESHHFIEMMFTLAEPTGMFSWGGIIQSRDEAVGETTLYVVLKLGLFHYKDGWHEVGGSEKNRVIVSGGFGEPSIILAGHRYYGESGRMALRQLTGVTRIDWGDGTVEDFDEGSSNDTYDHTWHPNEDTPLPSVFEIRIYGCTRIGDYSFAVLDALNDLGNQYIHTIIIRDGIEDIGSMVTPRDVDGSPVTIVMDRYQPPDIIATGTTSNSFGDNVTKIIVPSESVIADYNEYWNYTYQSIIQAPITEIPAGSGGGASGGCLGEPSLRLSAKLQNEVVSLSLKGVTAIDWGDGTVETFPASDTIQEYSHTYVASPLVGTNYAEVKIYGLTEIASGTILAIGSDQQLIIGRDIRSLGVRCLGEWISFKKVTF